MNWKEELEKQLCTSDFCYCKPEQIQAFISTQIIEKLIEDIPSEIQLPDWFDNSVIHNVDASQIEQQLRKDWL